MRIWKVWIIGLLLTLSAHAEDEEALAANLSWSAYGDVKSFKACYGDRFKIKDYAINGVQFFKLSDKHREIVVFRGTDNMLNWLTNLQVVEQQFENVQGAVVHAGFYEIAQAARKKLSLDKEKLITVSGHSLGGGVALLVGALLHDEGYDVRVITFGAPPVGNDAFVEANVALEHIRFEHIFDLVPKADQKAIRALQELLDQIDVESIDYKRLKEVVAYLKSMPYNFIHHGEEREVTHILPMDSISPSELLMQPLKYHSMDSYLTPFQEEEE